MQKIPLKTPKNQNQIKYVKLFGFLSQWTKKKMFSMYYTMVVEERQNTFLTRATISSPHTGCSLLCIISVSFFLEVTIFLANELLKKSCFTILCSYNLIRKWWVFLVYCQLSSMHLKGFFLLVILEWYKAISNKTQ